jgi:hypothetical protein
MKDGEKLDAFVEATLDDTLAGYEAFLPAHVLATIRGSLVAHPVMRVLVREQAPIETPKAFSDEGVNPEALVDEKKDHG